MDGRIIRLGLCGLVLVLYLTSLWLPGIVYLHPPSSQPAVDTGLDVLEQGWLGILAGNVAWYGNLLGLIAFIMVAPGRAPRTAFGFALAAILVSLDARTFTVKMLDEGGSQSARVDHLGSGFYVWEAALVILAVAALPALLARYRRKV